MIYRLVFCLLILAGGPVWADCSDDAVELRGDWGELSFKVELADTTQERSRGLMFREDMARGAGMLFVYEKPQRATFWMKNTLIPLDMLFADKTGTILTIHHQAVPGDLTVIDGGPGIFAVLEVNGGLARQYGIKAGSVMRHPAFDDGPAAWSC